MADTDYTELFLPLAGRSLSQFCVGSGVRLDLNGSPHYEITIESPLSIDELNVESLDPTSPVVLAALRDLLMSPVLSVTEDGGELSIAFPDVTIAVAHDVGYEAWQIRADNGLMIVCIPGGDLAVWLPE